MSFGTLAAMEALRRQVSRQQADFNERLERRKESRGAVGDDAAPAEALGCPSCQARYSFGYDCPRCERPLVGVSFLAAATEEAATPQPALEVTGPRYSCAVCERRSAHGGGCRDCGSSDLLDLHDPADLQLLAARQGYRAALRQQRQRRIKPTAAALSLMLLTMVITTYAPLGGSLLSLLWMLAGITVIIAGLWVKLGDG